MTQREVYEYLSADLGKGMADTAKAYTVESEIYALPTREWVLGPFARAFYDDLCRIRGSAIYAPVRFNCNKFGLAAMALAQWSHELSTNYPVAIAFGRIGYMKQMPDASLPQGHMINVAIVQEPNRPQTRERLYFEPQTQREVSLTQEEKDSCFFLDI